MDIKSLLKLHKSGFENKELIEKTDECGCFYCKTIFKPNEIKDWCDDGKTAICPYCGVDSVICNTDDYKVCENDLRRMYNYFFKETN